MNVVLTVVAVMVLGAVSVVSVFMSGFTGETAGRIVARAVFCLLLILVVLYMFQ